MLLQICMQTKGLLQISFHGHTRDENTKQSKVFFSLKEERKNAIKELFHVGEYNLVHFIDFVVDDLTGEILQTNLETLKRELKEPIEINKRK